MENPNKEHQCAIKKILRYVNSASNIALCYGGSDFIAKGYVDSNYASDLDKSKFTTSYVFTLAEVVVSWVLKLQSIMATSTTKEKYIAAT